MSSGLSDWTKKIMIDRLKDMLCYLSGPMDRVTWTEATDWRNRIKEFLVDINVGILDPCDKACSFGVENERIRENIEALKEKEGYNEIQEMMKPVCAIDLRMVDIAHFLILYLDLDVHMAGSYNEAFLAVNQKKPVLIMCKQGKQNIPNWLFGVVPHEMMFSDWIELRSYLNFINSGEEVKHMNRWRFLDMDHIYGATTRRRYK